MQPSLGGDSVVRRQFACADAPPGRSRATPSRTFPIFGRLCRSALVSIISSPILLCPEKPIVRIVDPDLTDRMSEWVVMHALVHLRQLRRYERQQRERLWADDDKQPKASDVQVGLLGLGVMGKDAAAKLTALALLRSPAGAQAQSRCPVSSAFRALRA